MLRSAKEITGFTLLASDGEIGKCDDFLFDDQSWAVRYMVAKTTRWLPGRKVIVSPAFLDEPGWSDGRFPVRLTQEQIEHAPPLDQNAPVSRQYEIAYHEHYALPFYWVGSKLWGTYPDPSGVIHPVSDWPQPEPEEIRVEEDRLRSMEEVTGYHIAARDGEVGHVEDFLIDDTTWALRYLVVDTRNVLPGRKVLLSPHWIDSIEWATEKVHVALDVESIKSSPDYDPARPVDRRYESSLFDHYGRPYYW